MSLHEMLSDANNLALLRRQPTHGTHSRHPPAHQLYALNTDVSHLMTEFRLNDDVNDSQSGLNNALVSSFI